MKEQYRIMDKKKSFTAYQIALLMFALLMISSFRGIAQKEDDPELMRFAIGGITEKQEKNTNETKILPGVNITLYKNGEKIDSTKSGKKESTWFNNLEWGYDYMVVFNYPGCAEMFMVADAKIPKNKYDLNMGFGINYILYDLGDKRMNPENLKKYPIIKVLYNGKKEMRDDKKYTADFKLGIIKQKEEDEAKAKLEKIAKEKEEAELKEKRKKEEELQKKRIKIAGKLLVGENPSLPIANANVQLVNDKGEVVQTVTTNFLGAFVFNTFLPNQNYSIKLDESNPQVAPNVKVIFTNKNEKEIMTSFSDGNGKFMFKLLGSDTNKLSMVTVSDTDLKIDLKGKLLSGDARANNKPLADLQVNLMDRMLKVIQQTRTDKEGKFVFMYLEADENYIVAVDENDPQLATLKKLVLADDKGNVVREIQPDKDKKFKFDLLPSDKNKMSEMYVDDPWLNVLKPKKKTNTNEKQEIVIAERVYFKVNDEKLLPDAERTLDKVIAIMKNVPDVSIELSSHTDSQGSDDYNMTLSQKRAKAAVDYMTAHGISATRVTGIGYGESHLLNNCGNGVKCSDEEHAKNRRLEFKVSKK